MTVAPLIAMKSSQVKSFDAVGRELDRRTRAAAIDRRVAVSRRVNGRFSDYGAAWSALAQI